MVGVSHWDPMGRLRFIEVLALFLLLSSTVSCAKGEPADKEKDAAQKNPEKQKYLYNADDAAPVIEVKSELDPEYNFIFSPNNGPRVVEFYAPWCPHCQKFRDSYVKLAKKINAVAADAGYKQPIPFYAVSCTANRDLCKKMDLNGFPQVKLFKANATTITEHPMFSQLHPLYILKALQIQIDELPLGGDSLNDSERNDESSYQVAVRSIRGLFGPESKHETLFVKATKKQVFDDAYLSFVFALRNEIYTSEGPLPKWRKQAFRKWLDFLQKTLPMAWKIQKIINAILLHFDSATEREQVLQDLVDEFVTNPAPSWSPACTKGVDALGYTCGLWELFHIVSVGLTEWNRFNPQDKDMRMAVSAEEAGQMLRVYIANFFGCKECRDNFVTAYDNCFLDRCNRLKSLNDMTHWKKFPLWLFDMHNAVNVRLMKEKALKDNRTPTAQDEIAKQWPSRQDCPKCWNNDGSVEHEAIFTLLRIEYWPEDSVTKAYRKELDLDEASLASAKRKTVLLSPSLRLGICLAIVLVGCAWGRKKRRDQLGYHKKVDLL